MKSIFNGHPYMTDATVENPDYSEAELITVEPVSSNNAFLIKFWKKTIVSSKFQ